MRTRPLATGPTCSTLLLSVALVACSGDPATNAGSGGTDTASGGASAVPTSTGGTTALGLGGGSSTVRGTGGALGTGGAIPMGGQTSGALGGTRSTGGSTSTGVTAVTGGMTATGGTKSSGGGSVSTGGSATGASGGTKTATGGMPAGGGVATGGTKAATGGMPATGGAATGGTKATGGAATGGMKATGGSPAATSCSFPSSWAPGSPTYTTYSLPNAQTACGYNGNNNTIKNIAVAANFAAIPDSSTNFAKGDRCGACVQIGSAIITIVDECPTTGGQNAPCAANLTGHLDLSAAAASAGGVKGDPAVKNQNAWKFIPCPVNGNVMVRLKNGNNNEFFIENEILPIQSVTCNGAAGSRTSYGAWHFSASSVAGQSCTATDIGNRSITFTVGSSQGQDVDTGSQFPKCN